MSYDRLTFKSYKKDTNVKPSSQPPLPIRQPPKPSLVRLFKLAFPFCFAANVAIAGYMLLRAKQRDDANGKPSKWGKGSPRAFIPDTVGNGEVAMVLKDEDNCED